MIASQLRLRRESEVRAARARGKAVADGPLVARILPNGTEPPQNRYTVVAGKKVGKAVERNRAKRVVREALRRLHPRLTPGHDIVVIVRGTRDELSGTEVALASLERIAVRARLLDAWPAASPSESERGTIGRASGEAAEGASGPLASSRASGDDDA